MTTTDLWLFMRPQVGMQVNSDQRGYGNGNGYNGDFHTGNGFGNGYGCGNGNGQGTGKGYGGSMLDARGMLT